MKQAGRWPLLAQFHLRSSRKWPTRKKKPPNAGAAPAAAAASPPPVSADADADQPTPPPGAPAATPSTDSTSPPPRVIRLAAQAPAAGAGGVDICQITPDAPQCQVAKEVNMATEGRKADSRGDLRRPATIRAESAAIRAHAVLRCDAERPIREPQRPGLALNYYVTQVLAVGVNGNWYDGLNADSDFNFQNRRAARIAVPLNDYQLSADLNFTYVPMYGKFSGFGDFIFHYDAYIDGGLGVIRTKPEAVIDPDNRKFDWNTLVNFDVGIGLRIFFNRWVAAVVEVRDLMFFDRIEATTLAPSSTLPASNPQSQLNPATWYDSNTHFTNDVQMQVGLSFFLPTSFEYRLPK